MNACASAPARHRLNLKLVTPRELLAEEMPEEALDLIEARGADRRAVVEVSTLGMLEEPRLDSVL